MHLAVRNADKRGDIAMQVQQRVHLDGGFVLAKLGPREQRQAQVDRGRVHRVQALIEIHADRVGRIQRPGDADQYLREVSVDAPVVTFIGVGQRRPRHAAVKAHVIELAAQGVQARFYVAKALPVSQLGKGHRQILVPTGESTQSRIAVISRHAASKLAVRQKAQQLGEDGSALVHGPLSPVRTRFPKPLAVQIAASRIAAQLIAGKGLVSRT
jgi:hypothetical protein